MMTERKIYEYRTSLVKWNSVSNPEIWVNNKWEKIDIRDLKVLVKNINDFFNSFDELANLAKSNNKND